MGCNLSIEKDGWCKIIVHPPEEHKKTLIWLHGFGSWAESFVPIFDNTESTPVDQNTKVILLNSGAKRISKMKLISLNWWFDIYQTDFTDLSKCCNITQLEESRLKITDLIHREVRENLGGDYSKLMIGGFSQGASMALYVASKLTPEESEEGNDQSVLDKDCNEENIRGQIMSSGCQNQFLESKPKRNIDSDSIEMQVDDQLNGINHLKKSNDEIENIRDENKTNTNLGAVIFWSGFHLFQEPETEIFKTNKFPVFVNHGIDDKMIKWNYAVTPFYEILDNKTDKICINNIGHSIDDNWWLEIRRFLKLINDKNNV